ncbi:MerR family transcriptional regulator [Actinokineospora diospyrosa]|uniref:MerR family transcriptional regulator n=1 Tax=Actinokineospora diospyrosa TaxID=103728 RepID=UPI0020A57971|nr:MerR family transcriptional regulator [Actinokineospora diospyrosa]
MADIPSDHAEASTERGQLPLRRRPRGEGRVTKAAEPTLPVAAVASRLGIAPSTLRTWDRRYGLGPTGHATGAHRRYGPADVARLELMRRALLEGAAPAQAAEYALRATPGEATSFGRTTPHGGRRLSLRGEASAARGLGRAAMAMDDRSVQRIITEAIDASGVVTAWDEVVRPVLNAVAGRWTASGDCVEVEHLVNECVLAAMIRQTPLVPVPRNPRPVMLCCAPQETHSLPLYVLRAALARREIGTIMLGAAVPEAALTAAVRRTAPAAVVVWAQLPVQQAALAKVPRTGQRAHVFAGGPGWAEVDLPPRAERLVDLPGAVARIEALLLADHGSETGSTG